MFRWGEKELLLLRNGYTPFTASGNGVEQIKIIADTAGAARLVFQKGGRDARKAALNIAVLTKGEADAFELDFENATERIFTGKDGESVNCFISAFSQKRVANGKWYDLSLELTEVGT